MDRHAVEQALAVVEARLGAKAASVELQVERAGLLATLGRHEQAREAYLQILGVHPGHFVALNNFGVLLHETNYVTAARTVFGQAVAQHPQQPLGHINLANLLVVQDELALAREHYQVALRLDPDHVHAHQQLSALLHESGDWPAMREHRRRGFASEPSRSYPCLGEGAPIPLLVLCSTPGADVDWRRLVDNRRFAVTTLVAEFHPPGAPLPPHQLIFNTIGDADLASLDLQAAVTLLEQTAAPVLNLPARVLATGRAANAERLAQLPGVRAPRLQCFDRAALQRADATASLAGAGLGFPLLLRSSGFHNGRHFVRVDEAAALPVAVAGLPGAQLMAMQYLDARGADGGVRKYRVMMIDGRLYPLHLAISNDWKVHYATAGMRGQRSFQAEEARFLEHMPDVLGARAMAALQAIQATLALDYGGIDFALDAAGNVLLFEANAVMKIVPPDDSPEWDYRRPAVGRATAAARQLLLDRASGDSAGQRRAGA